VPYTDLLQLSLVFRTFLADVLPCLKILEITQSHESHLAPIHWFRVSTTLNICCFLLEGGESEEMDPIVVASRILSFLVSGFPNLENLLIGGCCLLPKDDTGDDVSGNARQVYRSDTWYDPEMCERKSDIKKIMSGSMRNSLTRLFVVALVRLASCCQRPNDPLGKHKHRPSAQTRFIRGQVGCRVLCRLGFVGTGILYRYYLS
jgi:hypothetical protein